MQKTVVELEEHSGTLLGRAIDDPQSLAKTVLGISNKLY